jgi:CelD/BcsL family acetyltransferase involved in cellulose biosynthesis
VTGASGSEPTVLTVADGTPSASVIEEWRQLARSLDDTTYFQTPDWVLNWWQDVGRPPTELALWRSAGGELEAVVFISLIREGINRRDPLPLSLTTNTGSGAHSGDHCGWPVRAHRRPDVQKWLANHHWGTSLLLRSLDPESGVPCVPEGGRLVLTTTCPRLEIPEDPAALNVSSNFRQQLKRYGRKQDKAGLTIEWHGPGTVTSDLIDTLFSLHESRRSLTGYSSFKRDRHADFQRRLAECGAEDRGPAMVLARCGDEPVGSLYGYVWRDTFSYLQGGWKADWEPLRLGYRLVAEAIRHSGLNGARVFDFLRGDEPYKYRFGATDRLDETWLVRRDVSGLVMDMKFGLVRARRTWMQRRRGEEESRSA